mmetsp:Transcript_112928/g.258606  ORF Transcript_112928/g.258606 Transcript_112928/m.258606 type:complete len:614 (-) Transcript_112928:126-1967(-)
MYPPPEQGSWSAVAARWREEQPISAVQDRSRQSARGSFYPDSGESPTDARRQDHSGLYDPMQGAIRGAGGRDVAPQGFDGGGRPATGSRPPTGLRDAGRPPTGESREVQSQLFLLKSKLKKKREGTPQQSTREPEGSPMPGYRSQAASGVAHGDHESTPYPSSFRAMVEASTPPVDPSRRANLPIYPDSQRIPGTPPIATRNLGAPSGDSRGGSASRLMCDTSQDAASMGRPQSSRAAQDPPASRSARGTPSNVRPAADRWADSARRDSSRSTPVARDTPPRAPASGRTPGTASRGAQGTAAPPAGRAPPSSAMSASPSARSAAAPGTGQRGAHVARGTVRGGRPSPRGAGDSHMQRARSDAMESQKDSGSSGQQGRLVSSASAPRNAAADPEPAQQHRPAPRGHRPDMQRCPVESQGGPLDIDELPVRSGGAELPPEYAPVEQMRQCPDCQRSFKLESFQKHRTICKKVFVQKRKTFSTVEKRLADQENAHILIANAKKTSKPKPGKAPAAKSKWRLQSEAFRAALMCARAAEQGGSELAAAEARASALNQELNSGSMTPCPHCGRTFRDEAAKRHIPICVKTFGGRPGRPSLPSSKPAQPTGAVRQRSQRR